MGNVEKGENTLKILLELNDMHIKEPCILCGDWFILDVVEAVAYIDNTRWGSVCENCLSVGEQEKKSKLNAYTQQVKDQARYTLKWAEELEQASLEEIISPSLEDFEKYVKEVSGYKKGAGNLNKLETEMAV